MLPSSSYMHHHHDVHTPTWRLGLPPVDRVGTVQTPHPSSHTSSCPIPIRVPERFTNRLQTMGGSWLHDGAGDSQVSAHLQVAKRFWERRELIVVQAPVREDEQGEATQQHTLRGMERGSMWTRCECRCRLFKYDCRGLAIFHHHV